MNVLELKARMVLESKTPEDMCSAIGISRSAWFRKTTGASEFTQSEISTMRQVLHLSDRDTAKIFFNEEVS